jgi:hypothetical protein
VDSIRVLTWRYSTDAGIAEFGILAAMELPADNGTLDG